MIILRLLSERVRHSRTKDLFLISFWNNALYMEFRTVCLFAEIKRVYVNVYKRPSNPINIEILCFRKHFSILVFIILIELTIHMSFR